MYTVEINNEIKTFLHMVKSAGTSVHAGIIQASNDYHSYKVHVNQRHASINNLPEKYRSYPKFIVLREPHKWYRSFYRFFLGVDGYLSWALNDPKEDGYIYPIEPDEYIRRMINMKDTLIKFPNKARVFRNLLRSQGHMHFVTGYFQSDFHPDDPETMEQFNMSLFDWFWRNVGGDEAIFIPMERLDIIEDLFKIKIPYVNETDPNKLDIRFSDSALELIKNTHSKYYQMLEDFDENKLCTLKEWEHNRSQKP
jgi:hypothetical protein